MIITERPDLPALRAALLKACMDLRTAEFDRIWAQGIVDVCESNYQAALVKVHEASYAVDAAERWA